MFFVCFCLRIKSVDLIIFSAYFARFITHSGWFCMPTSPLSVMRMNF